MLGRLRGLVLWYVFPTFHSRECGSECIGASFASDGDKSGDAEGAGRFIAAESDTGKAN